MQGLGLEGTDLQMVNQAGAAVAYAATSFAIIVLNKIVLTTYA